MKFNFLAPLLLIGCSISLFGCVSVQTPGISPAEVHYAAVSLSSTKMMEHLQALQDIAVKLNDFGVLVQLLVVDFFKEASKTLEK